MTSWHPLPGPPYGYRTEAENGSHYRATVAGAEGFTLSHIAGDAETPLGDFGDFGLACHGAERHSYGMPAQFDYRASFPNAGWDELRALPDLSIRCEGLDSIQAENQAKATFAARALVSYVDRVGGDEFETSVSDLLADVMHLCNALGIEFDDCLETAERRHDEELRGEL